MRAKGPRRPAVVAIIAAAGQGRRSGLRLPKQFLRVGGRTLLEHAVSRLAGHPEVDAVVVVVPAGRLAWAERRVGRAAKVAAVVPGGARRQDSVEHGLRADPARRAEIVVIHDAARPLVPAAVISAVIRAARRSGAAVPGVPPSDTVKVVGRGGRVVRTLPRDTLRMIQTPQAFRASWLRKAYERAASRGMSWTDDASIVEAAGRPVRVVPGSPESFKVTNPQDLALLRALVGRR